MSQDMIAELAQIIARDILKDPECIIKEDEALLSSGLIDSFSLVDLSLLIEDRYGVRIEDTELNPDSFDSLAQLATLIQSRIA
jgi:acyl carrier protein